MSKNKNSAAFQEFLKFKEYILGKFLEKFGRSYDNVENLRDRWFHEYAYTADAEQFLIDESRFYLRICSNPREIKFLNTLTTHMADYLSEYTMRYIEYPDRDARRAGRKAAKEQLKAELYTKNPYIQNLVFKKTKRGIFQTDTRESDIRRKRARIQRFKNDMDIHNQVKAEFIDVSQYKPKR